MEEVREPHTSERETKIKLLETERDIILREEEELWRIRSRAVWLKCGDKNTNFFHNFASFERNKNHIWEISDEEGQTHTSVEAIKNELVKFFKSFYQKSNQVLITDQVKTTGLFDCLVHVVALMHTCKRELSPAHLVCPRRHNV
jgi:hypothetical protein